MINILSELWLIFGLIYMLKVMLSIVILSQFFHLSTRYFSCCWYLSSDDKYIIHIVTNFLPDQHAQSHAQYYNIIMILPLLCQIFLILLVFEQ